MTKPDDLIAYLFDGKRSPLAGEVKLWLDASPRFTAFADAYRDKIRKKLRTARDPGSAQDVLRELEAAYRLLADRRLEMAYEPYASAKARGPDFAVTYRANLVFNIEVARLRAQENGAEEASPRIEDRLLRVLLAKLGQMQPGMANLLLIHAREDAALTVDLSALMHSVKARVEARDPAFYAASRYPTPAAFYKDFLHLSAILLWTPDPQPWANKQARPLLDEKILRLVASLASGAEESQ